MALPNKPLVPTVRCHDVASMKWKIAALTLVTWPAAFWYLAQSPNGVSPRLTISLASLPLFVAICIEAHSHWKLIRERPESYVEGSRIGNRIAAILGVILLGLLLALIYGVATNHT
jgi:hypothetical protein